MELFSIGGWIFPAVITAAAALWAYQGTLGKSSDWYAFSAVYFLALWSAAGLISTCAWLVYLLVA